MSQGMDTYAARLASFNVAVQPAKQRASNAKSAKPITWPHSRPSPAELADAGFYYNPYETNPDNTTCFLCNRALDGWEEGDDPITEHIKHSSDCGWAIIMDIQRRTSNPSEIEDPTSPRVVEARKATFGSSWPYDGKRGWNCQSQKMADGGWYFCPTGESEDLASCAYCKLSLDGWEPKDDPYEEHYRRSATCAFFVFAQASGKNSKRPPRSKRSRVSKGSRLSTQSTATVGSEALTIESDDTMNQSPISLSTFTTTKGSKKQSKSRRKNAKGKKNESTDVSGQADPGSNEQLQNSKSKRGPRGKKRQNHEISEDSEDRLDCNVPLEPLAKKRVTNSRNSISEQPTAVSVGYENENVTALPKVSSTPVPKKARKPVKKGDPEGRKPSATSNASKASLRPRIPDSDPLDAAPEINPGSEMAKVDNDRAVPHHKQTASHEEGRFKSEESTASVAPMRSTQQVRDSREPKDSKEHNQDYPNMDDVQKPILKTDPQRVEGWPETSNKPAKAQGTTIGAMNDCEPANLNVPNDKPTVPEHHDSPPAAESVAELPSDVDMGMVKVAAKTKPVARKAKAGKASKIKTNLVGLEMENASLGADKPRVEDKLHNYQGLKIDQQQIESSVDKQLQQHKVDDESVHRISKVPPKTAERYSDIPPEQHRTHSFLGSLANENNGKWNDTTRDANHSASARRLPQPIQEDRPSPSPQSSDAENRPPSTRPSTLRPPIASPLKGQMIRVPLAPSTPPLSPSKRLGQTAFLTSSYPWTPVDVDEFFAADDKQSSEGTMNNPNTDLTTPEKMMTVEEWIRWNAKNGEEKLRTECENLVGGFEKEGVRAMRALEGIECTD